MDSADFAAGYAKGIADGRRQIQIPVQELIEHMLEITKETGPVEMHTNTCWQRHVRCALRSVSKRVGRPGSIG